MSSVEHVVLIHGTWTSASVCRDAKAAFEARGFIVHAPTLRHHELSLQDSAVRVASVSLSDYANDLVTLCEALSSPPLLVGVSMGGLLAQLVAARTAHAGLLIASPAPAAGIFGLYPGTIRLFARHFLQLRPWSKPLYPTWKAWRFGVTNTQDDAFAREWYPTLVAESGRAYCEMAFPWLDRRRAARVDFDAVQGPVLVLAGRDDRVIAPAISRATAARYREASFIEIPDPTTEF